MIPSGVIDAFNDAVRDTRCSHQDGTEAAVMLWVSLSNDQRALLNVRIGNGKPVNLADFSDSSYRGEGAVAESEETYFLRVIDRYSEKIKAFSRTEQAGVKKLIAELAANRIVDAAEADVEVQKQKRDPPGAVAR